MWNAHSMDNEGGGCPAPRGQRILVLCCYSGAKMCGARVWEYLCSCISCRIDCEPLSRCVTSQTTDHHSSSMYTRVMNTLIAQSCCAERPLSLSHSSAFVSRLLLIRTSVKTDSAPHRTQQRVKWAEAPHLNQGPMKYEAGKKALGGHYV